MKRTAIPLMTIAVATSAHAEPRATPVEPAAAASAEAVKQLLAPAAKQVRKVAARLDRVAASAVPAATAANALRVRLLANGAPACGNIMYRNLKAQRSCLPKRQLTVFTALRPRP